jgi:hypothetical protein
VLLSVALALLIWIALSFVLAPILGMTLRRLEVLEDAHDLTLLRAKAQHPAKHAA